MLLIAGVFLLNLLCGFAPCDVHNRPPEILQQPQTPVERRRNQRVSDTPPVVQLPSGTLEGYVSMAMNGRLFVAFEGIEYGIAKRFEVPTPAKPWRGVRQAKSPGAPCLQLNPAKIFRAYGSERCLYANVYTPQLPSSQSDLKKFPVIVFIHGGAFILGQGVEYGPTYLLSEDVVLVTINYRLGVLGFLSTGDEVMPGNQGLKDQALALKWVYENIAFFNGNPQMVSLWGQSAGAVSVHLHLISDKSRNYFSTAYSSSGTAFQHWAVQSKERMWSLAKTLGKNFGCTANNSRDLVGCLRNVEVNLLVARQMALYDWYPFPPVTFSPCVEPEHPDAFLTMTPTEAYAKGIVAKTPYVFGFTTDEGKNVMLMLLPLVRTLPLRRMWPQIAPSFLQLNGLVHDTNTTVEQINKFYFPGRNARQLEVNVLGEMVSDRYLNFGVLNGVQAHILSGSPTYTYLFSYHEGRHNIGNMIGFQSPEWGAGHIEDITYIFNTSWLVDGHRQDDPDHQLSKIMINLLVNFIKTGNPTFKTENGEQLTLWNPSKNPSKIDLLQLDQDIKMIPLPTNMATRVQFWDSLLVDNMTLWRTMI